MIIKCVPPEDSWEKCKIRILSKGKIYDDFLCAINAAKKAEYTSDINSDDEKRRLKFPNRKIQSSSSEEEDNDYIKGIPRYPTSAKTTKTKSTDHGKKISDNMSHRDHINNKIAVIKSKGPILQYNNWEEKEGNDNTNNDDHVKELCPSGLFTTTITNDSEATSSSESLKEVDPTDDLIGTFKGNKGPNDEQSNADNTRLIKALVKQFVQLNKKVDIIMTDVTTILNGQVAVNNNSQPYEVAVDQQFPLSNITELEQFDTKLLDKHFYENMVKFIHRIGGIDVNQFVKRVLTRILSNEVQCQLNWLGKRGEKKSFKDLRFCKALTDGILQNKSTQVATEMEIEKSIKNFLRHASDRLKSERRVEREDQ